MIGYSKFLPSVFTIRGLRAAQGFVFMDEGSAWQWLRNNVPDAAEHVTVAPAEVIFYGGALGGKTTEDIMKERLTAS